MRQRRLVATDNPGRPQDQAASGTSRNPLDVVMDALRCLQGRSSTPVACTSILDRLRPAGYNADQIREALENWQSLGLVLLDAQAQHASLHLAMIDEIESDVPAWITRGPAPVAPAPPAATTPAIALLSLFDGVGMARVGTDGLLRQLGGK